MILAYILFVVWLLSIVANIIGILLGIGGAIYAFTSLKTSIHFAIRGFISFFVFLGISYFCFIIGTLAIKITDEDIEVKSQNLNSNKLLSIINGSKKV